MAELSMAATTSVVFGGRGFIGSHLVDLLIECGGHVRSFDRPHALSGASVDDRSARLEQVQGDFTSSADVARALAGRDYCFHLVSTTLPKGSNDDPAYDVESNLVSSIRLMEHAARLGVRKIVFVSSGGTVYGTPQTVPIPESHPTHPICSYGITKLGIENYLHLFKMLHGLDYQVLRLSNPFGERQRTESSQGAIAVFLAKALRGEAIEIWGDGSVVRDYIHISDVVRAIALAAVRSSPQAVLNIGSGQGISLNHILATMESLLGRAIERTYSAPRPFDVPVNVLDIALAKAHLDWQPRVEFGTGLQGMIEALKNRRA